MHAGKYSNKRFSKEFNDELCERSDQQDLIQRYESEH